MRQSALDLGAREYQELARILGKYRWVGRFYAFGSRIRGRARPFSDLDVLIRSPAAIAIRTLGAIERDLSESRLPFRVDVVDAGRAAASFLAAIAGEAIEIRTD